jgi:hypothetical protein
MLSTLQPIPMHDSVCFLSPTPFIDRTSTGGRWGRAALTKMTLPETGEYPRHDIRASDTHSEHGQSPRRVWPEPRLCITRCETPVEPGDGKEKLILQLREGGACPVISGSENYLADLTIPRGWHQYFGIACPRPLLPRISRICLLTIGLPSRVSDPDAMLVFPLFNEWSD